MLEELKECKLCPHMCKINRLEGKVGRCKATDKIKISLVSLHQFEEPCISGTNGSGTIFFSNCNCVFCQNYKISQEGMGQEVDIDFLAKSMIEQQEKGAHNINLVTPVMYVYHIIEAIKIAIKKGLKIPIIYNSNGYENIDVQNGKLNFGLTKIDTTGTDIYYIKEVQAPVGYKDISNNYIKLNIIKKWNKEEEKYYVEATVNVISEDEFNSIQVGSLDTSSSKTGKVYNEGNTSNITWNINEIQINNKVAHGLDCGPFL